MFRRLFFCLPLVLLAGVASAQVVDDVLDRTPPVLAVVSPAPCARLHEAPAALNGIAFDLESGISDLRVWLVTDCSHGWKSWDGYQWVEVQLVEQSTPLRVTMDSAENMWSTLGALPSIEDGTLCENEKVHIFVRATNGQGLDSDWISCYQIVDIVKEVTPSDS